MEILAGAAIVLLLITCFTSIQILMKVSAETAIVTELNVNSKNVYAQLQEMLDELNDFGEVNVENSPIGLMPPGQRRIFKSLDGKYTADTFEQLMDMMKKDMDYKEINDLLPGEEGDDDDEETPPWKQNKEI